MCVLLPFCVYGLIWQAGMPKTKHANNQLTTKTPSAHLRLFRLVHFTQDVFCMGLQRGEAGGFRRRRRLFSFLRFLLPSFLDLRDLWRFGGLGHLWGFRRLGRLGRLGSFLSGFLSAGRGDMGRGNGIFRLGVGGWWFLHWYLNAGLTLDGFCCILEKKAEDCEVSSKVLDLCVLFWLLLVNVSPVC